MNNHIVSRFIIKKFGKNINAFNIKTGEILEGRNPRSVFNQLDAIDSEIESKLNTDIETPFASKLLNQIQSQEQIVLKRADVFKIKQYCLMTCIRSLGEKGFAVLMNAFKPKADNLLRRFPELKTCSKRLSDFDWNEHDLYMEGLRISCDFDDAEKMLWNGVPLEIYCWAKPFWEAFLSIWESNDKQNFILSDAGMESEREGVYETLGLDLSKTSYLTKKSIIAFKKGNKAESCTYQHLADICDCFYENYNIFNISPTRSIVLINPFFRLYSGTCRALVPTNEGESKIISLPKPDIWPAILQNKNALTSTPTVHYEVSESCRNMNDTFTYKPIKLTYWDTIFINSLIISRTNEFIGFGKENDISDSIAFYFVQSITSQTDFPKENSNRDAEQEFIDKLEKSPWKKLVNYLGINIPQLAVSSCILYGEIVPWILKDQKENPYIWERLIQNRDHLFKKGIFKLCKSEEECRELLKSEYEKAKERFKKIYGYSGDFI